MVADPQRDDDESHQPEVQRGRRDGETADEAEGERREVVSDLVLGELLRPQPDDGEHAEEAQPQTGVDRARRQRGGHGEDADVHPEVRDDEAGR